MDYIQALTEEFKDLEKSLEEGKISKYEAANMLMDISALIEAKKANQQSLKQEFSDAKSDAERELIRGATKKQQEEQSKLENLILSFSASLKDFQEKKNNIIHF